MHLQYNLRNKFKLWDLHKVYGCFMMVSFKRWVSAIYLYI